MSVPITAGVNTAIAAELDAAGAYQQSIILGGRIVALLSSVSINVAGAGDNSIVAAVAAQKTRLFKFFLMATGGAVDIKWRDGLAGTDFHPVQNLLAKGSSWMLPYDTEAWFTTSVNSALVLNLSAAVQVSGRAYYITAV